MALPKTFYGTSRDVPQSGERNWGNTMTQVVADLIDGLDGITLLLASGVSLLKLESTDSTLADGATFTPTHPAHRIQGDGGAATADATTAIADGSTDGQILVLFGVSDVNTVTIEDGSNTSFNGDVILTNGICFITYWDSTNSVWRELTRNN